MKLIGRAFTAAFMAMYFAATPAAMTTPSEDSEKKIREAAVKRIEHIMQNPLAGPPPSWISLEHFEKIKDARGDKNWVPVPYTDAERANVRCDPSYAIGKYSLTFCIDEFDKEKKDSPTLITIVASDPVRLAGTDLLDQPGIEHRIYDRGANGLGGNDRTITSLRPNGPSTPLAHYAVLWHDNFIKLGGITERWYIECCAQFGSPLPENKYWPAFIKWGVQHVMGKQEIPEKYTTMLTLKDNESDLGLVKENTLIKILEGLVGIGKRKIAEGFRKAYERRQLSQPLEKYPEVCNPSQNRSNPYSNPVRR